jgi:hypothetical protein
MHTKVTYATGSGKRYITDGINVAWISVSQVQYKTLRAVQFQLPNIRAEGNLIQNFLQADAIKD